MFFWQLEPSSPPVPVRAFLASIGTQSAIAARGEKLDKTIECVRYLGVRWLRAGVEGNVSTDDFLKLHQLTGVVFSWGLGSGGVRISRLLETARPLARQGALLAFEGPNEPNNWGITYQGLNSKTDHTWRPIALLQRDLFAAVKADPVLQKFPVWTVTEPGAESDNVGLQFLKIPAGAGCVMPAGTQYGEFANVHNYLYHPNSPSPVDNKVWNAADPSSACRVDGLYGEFGRTWAHHYAGYPQPELDTLPRVTTETGCLIEGPVTEEIQAKNLLTLYLDQFKRGWSYTANYLLRDRVDEAGNQKFGYFTPDYHPRKSAVYLHNLTTILSQPSPAGRALQWKGRLMGATDTVHDLVLQAAGGALYWVIWDERVTGADKVRLFWSNKGLNAKLYDPTVGTNPISTLNGDAPIDLELSDHPLILRFETRPLRLSR